MTNGKPAWALGCNIYRKRATETDYSLIAFDTASPYVDTVTGPAVNVSYKAAYRGVRATDIGGSSAEPRRTAGRLVHRRPGVAQRGRRLAMFVVLGASGNTGKVVADTLS